LGQQFCGPSAAAGALLRKASVHTFENAPSASANGEDERTQEEGKGIRTPTWPWCLTFPAAGKVGTWLAFAEKMMYWIALASTFALCCFGGLITGGAKALQNTGKAAEDEARGVAKIGKVIGLVGVIATAILAIPLPMKLINFLLSMMSWNRNPIQ